MIKLYFSRRCRLLLLQLVLAMISHHAFSQISITGTVKGDDGNGLPGVNVVIKGTTQGTVTDVDGKYTLDVPSKESVLVFSFIGYGTEEAVVGDKTVIDFMLTPDLTTLSEVVVVGYGTEKKKDLTGAISTISAQDITRVPVLSPLDALAARAPGLNITSTSGMPGVAPTVIIRGVTSFGGNDNNSGGAANDFMSKNAPIYVIDGLITEGISNISPNDIESISVLKDASAAAVYGARAAHGVIIVTTKRGTGKGRPTITFNTFVGFQGEGNLRRDLLNSEQYLEIFNESYDNEGQPKLWSDSDMDQYDGVYTDWKKLVKRTGVLQNYEVSVTGGDENSNYYVSGGYKDNKLMVKGYDFNKYTLVLNSDHKAGKWIKFGNSLNLYATETNGATANLGGTFWQDALTSVPIKRAYEDDGSYGRTRNTALENGGNVMYAIDNNVDNTKYKGLMGNIYLTIQPINNLKFTIKESIEWEQRYVTTFRPSTDPNLNIGGSLVNQITKNQRQTGHTITDFLVDYNKQFGDSHNVSALLGYSVEEWQREELEAFRSGTPSNEIQYVGAGDPSTSTNKNTFNDWAFLSMFGKLNYSFQDKYLVGLTVRRDGSSKLAQGDKYGIFPSASFGWRLSKEGFMSSVTLVNDLKIRGSWGQLGNVNVLDNYATVAALTSLPYAANQIIVPGYTFSDAVNSNITWETAVKSDIGLDATILDNHIYTTIDYYIEDTKDLLLARPLSASAGKTPGNFPFVNAGKVRNSGIEALVGYVTSVNDWTFDVNVNMAHNKNEVIDLGGADYTTSGIIEGYPVRSFFGYKSGGVIQDQDMLANNPQGPLFTTKEPGDLLFMDVGGRDENGNRVQTPDGQVNADDRWVIGSRYPKIVYGMMGTVGYKNFTLQLQLQGVGGLDRDISTTNDYGLFHYYQRWALNHDAMILDRWHETKNPDGQMPRVDVTDKGKNRMVNSFWLKDASYLRIKNVNLNYNFQNDLIEPLNLRSLNVYISIQNLWTFTNFPGQEVDSTVDPMTGVPQPRVTTIGLRASF